jgi:hypothetical protein
VTHKLKFLNHVFAENGCDHNPKKLKKGETKVNYKFQKVWALKMPRVKPIINEVGLVGNTKCCVCISIERKEKVFVIKGDSIKKIQVRERS